MKHLDEGELQALLDGEMSAADARAAEAHLAGCVPCTQTAAELRMAREVLVQGLSLTDVAPPVAAAQMSLRARRARAARWSGEGRRALARAAALVALVAGAASAVEKQSIALARVIAGQDFCFGGISRSVPWVGGKSPGCTIGRRGSRRCYARATSHPCLPLIRSMRDGDEAHQRMLPAAILGANSAEFAWPVCLDAEQGAAAGYHVFLARQVRHPEAVNDIGGFEFEHHGAADRNVNLVCILHRDPALIVEVLDPEPPHLAGHANAHLVAPDRLRQAGRQGQAPDQQSRQHHAGKRDPADPDRTLAA